MALTILSSLNPEGNAYVLADITNILNRDSVVLILIILFNNITIFSSNFEIFKPNTERYTMCELRNGIEIEDKKIFGFKTPFLLLCFEILDSIRFVVDCILFFRFLKETLSLP